MRLILLPISTRRSIIYCPKGSAPSLQKLSWLKSPLDKLATTGSEIWLRWEKRRGPYKTATVYGNKLFRRLPFEEWGLKTVPPLKAERKEEELQRKIKSHVEYPASLLKPEAVQEALQKYGSNEKQRYHSKWLWRSLLGLPLCFPLGVIPLIPNFPLFYVAFRAWSHWRARHGSNHIEFLVENSLFETRPSSILDKAYAVSSLGSSWTSFQQDLNAPRQAITKPEVPTEQMLLSQADGIVIAECLQIPELASEVERAVWQVENEIKARKELEDEKSRLKSVEKDNKRGT